MCLPEKALMALKSIELPEDIDELVEVDEEIVDEMTVKQGKSCSNGVVSVFAYLIGVPRDQFGKTFRMSTYEDLEKNEDAKIMRSLCTIRSALLRQYGSIYLRMKRDIKNLDGIPDYIDPGLFTYLESKKIRIITGSQIKDIYEYIITINSQINNRLTQVLRLFPAWVNTDYIRDVIAMPGGSNKDRIVSASNKMKDNINSYPFGSYINWPIERKDAFVESPEYFLDEVHTGNVIHNDRKFMVLLYRIHGEEFTDFGRVTDANEETKQQLSDFMMQHERIVMLVDCENSDPYKLCAVLDSMRETWGRMLLDNGGADVRLLEKIILFDDSRTVDAWDIISQHTSVPIEHREVERVLQNKSLVDIVMTAGACREHYENGVNAFVVASSDSDYWGMISSLPKAEFLVLAERENLSRDAEKHYERNGVPICLMDEFADNLSGIKEDALCHGLEKRINNLMTINIDDILDALYSELRLDMSSREKENFRASVGRELKLSISGGGDVIVKVA